MYPDSIKNLAETIAHLPSIGKRQALRLIFYLIRNQDVRRQLIQQLNELEKKIKICERCFLPFEGPGQLCHICSNPSRSQNIIAIVEKEIDVFSIEQTNSFKGTYHILGHLIDPADINSYNTLRLDQLEKRIRRLPQQIADEIIIAISPTTEGDLTAMYLERKLKNLAKKISRIGRGIPTGGEIEFADAETLKNALSNRR
ncbi:MAG TPA: recombination mediator RecR [Candidatus Paceibacterota bacterium]|nr:recombination mediator RecR [Candidatus Paceibacterota bacterium]HOL53926.1 recombination mediator RecR [Candidatus Paceibacterota bacterium]HON21582.1 recombination mediator RecR [Candidatus Paceibacterota bacterium]HOV88503.1 recombination mediator RecR [Candidatus Paceibacterota bacterium]HPP16816.1 recombination mediator RecR [Candidatus Paceibacterota bacterium]